jgi:very-short-patch-repair endonuclease
MSSTGHTPLDRAIGAMATRQHGVVAIWQLRALGLGARGVAHRVAAGKLHPVHRGVYAVGHKILKTEGNWMAAVLACGPRAALSHHDAAELHGIRRRGSARTYVDVTVPTRAGRKRDRIRVHAGGALRAQDVTIVDAIPCTSVARTLLDLADISDQHAVNRDVERAEHARLFHLRAVDELLARSNGRRGVTRLRTAIDRWQPTITRNDMEDAFLTICEHINAPRPRVNVWIPAVEKEVDFMFVEQRVIIETDGYEDHGSRQARERDNRRDRQLRGLGWRVEHFTWREIVHEPDTVAAALAEILAGY